MNNVSRAKKADSDEWCYGTLVQYKKNSKEVNSIEIIENGKIVELIDIIPGTICSQTGYTDKSRNLIFEKDIVMSKGGMTGLVVLNNGESYFRVLPNTQNTSELCEIPLSIWSNRGRKISGLEIIGNLIDNPELFG